MAITYFSNHTVPFLIDNYLPLTQLCSWVGKEGFWNCFWKEIVSFSQYKSVCQGKSSSCDTLCDRKRVTKNNYSKWFSKRLLWPSVNVSCNIMTSYDNHFLFEMNNLKFFRWEMIIPINNNYSWKKNSFSNCCWKNIKVYSTALDTLCDRKLVKEEVYKKEMLLGNYFWLFTMVLVNRICRFYIAK